MTQYLNGKIPNRWIGMGGPITWPLRYLDHSSCDYFLWGYLKDIVYRNIPSTLEELESNIGDVVYRFDTTILEKVYRNLETRFSFVVRENGSRFEY